MPLDLHLTLIGRADAGKSSTVNSIILGLQALQGRDTPSTKLDSKNTYGCRTATVVLEDGRSLHLLDTPGLLFQEALTTNGLLLQEYLTTKEKRNKLNINKLNIKDTIKNSRDSYKYAHHAVLLVFRFGSKFLLEDLDMLNDLRPVFGDNFIRNSCIVVVSYGGYFKQLWGACNMTFPEWCRQKGGAFRHLYDQVNGRVVLFDNRATEEDKKRQRQDLIDAVDYMTLTSRRYIDAKFDEAVQRIQELEISFKELKRKSDVDSDNAEKRIKELEESLEELKRKRTE